MVLAYTCTITIISCILIILNPPPGPYHLTGCYCDHDTFRIVMTILQHVPSEGRCGAPRARASQPILNKQTGAVSEFYDPTLNPHESPSL